ncbi:putative CRISPR-associated protein [Deinococcus sp. S9]|uniref:putative CRISPR-associated protein n=1 Tax=Deinococcus sp. S9 TaxID=2545754 RepID=UPI0010553F4C|nr:putative CRISPR-associated protein [Deinococcus sp. S9]TDE86742.1 putative CRISPR-associated protein [Deinococcus sp. S9]
MSQCLISTVGTSLLGNANNPRVNPGGLSPAELLRRDPQRASAEANALTRLATPGDTLVFLHSDTEDGERCAGYLAEYFAELGYPVRCERIAGLSYHERGFVSHGLRSLVRLLAGEIRAARRAGQQPLLNATGGFKAEIAYATAVGLMFGVPVCYIHERFGDVVTLPASPVGWDYSLFTWYRDFFEWIDEQPRPTAQVRERLMALPDSVALLVEDASDGHSYLSPLGEAYLEAFRGQTDTRRPLRLSPSAQRTLDTLDFSTRNAYLHLLERLRQGRDREWQRSTETLSGGVLKFPKGHSVHRAFFVEREGILHVLELCGHDNERHYQELMRTIRWSQYQNSTFQDLP